MDVSSSSQSRESPSRQTVAKRATYDAQDCKKDREAPQSRSKSVDSPNARFACHFFIASPRKLETNAICSRTTWPSIPRLKEHLYRRHGEQRPSCPRCACTFEKQKDLEEHLRAEKPCKISDRPKQSISPAQMHMLKKRKGQYNGPEYDKWFEIWDMLFPDRARPKSPYLEVRDGIYGWGLRVMDDLQELVERRVSDTVLDKLDENHVPYAKHVEERKKIKALISESVGSAFKDYKSQVDSQHERITELHEEPEQIPEHLEGYKYEDVAGIKRSMSQFSALSNSNSTVSTGMSPHIDYSTMPTCSTLMGNTQLLPKPLEQLELCKFPPLSTPFFSQHQGLVGGQFAQGYQFVPNFTEYRQEDGPLLLGDSAYCGRDFHNGSWDGEDDGSMDFGAAFLAG